MSKLAPGINLFAQVILYGRRLAGTRGVAAALLGFAFPSVAITIVLSAALISLENFSATRDAMRLVIPVTGAMTMVVAVQMWGPVREAPIGRLAAEAAIVLLCALLVGLGHVPVPAVMLGAVFAGALVNR